MRGPCGRFSHETHAGRARTEGRQARIARFVSAERAGRMIIVVKPESTQEQIDHIVERIHEMGLRTDVSRGIKRTIIGVIGEEDVVRNAPLRAIPGVEEVVPILKPFKLASREYQPEDS